MKATVIPDYVAKASGNEIQVKTSNQLLINRLLDLGFRPSAQVADLYLVAVSTDEEKAKMFSRLRDEGVCFSRGKEWNPAEVFEWLKDKGLLTGAFLEIAWKGPGEWVIREIH